MDIESREDLKKALDGFGYSSTAVTNIVKWYCNGKNQSMQ